MMDTLEEHTGTIILGDRMITNLQFTNIIMGLACKEDILGILVQCLARTSTAYGMEINAEKPN